MQENKLWQENKNIVKNVKIITKYLETKTKAEIIDSYINAISMKRADETAKRILKYSKWDE